MSQQAIQAAEAKLRQRLSEFQVLREVGQLFLEAQDSKNVIDQVLQKIIEACVFNLGTILLPDSEGSRGSVAAVYGGSNPANVHRRPKQKVNYGMDAIIDAPVVLDCIQEQSGMRTLKTRRCRLRVLRADKSGGENLGFL